MIPNYCTSFSFLCLHHLHARSVYLNGCAADVFDFVAADDFLAGDGAFAWHREHFVDIGTETYLVEALLAYVTEDECGEEDFLYNAFFVGTLVDDGLFFVGTHDSNQMLLLFK